MKRFKTRILRITAWTGLLFALIAGVWMATEETAEAGPPIPNCQKICQRVYDLCIADGWAPAECEIKRQMCLDDCFGT